eukprot:1577810-Amphidinium_carterae.3
MPANGSAGPETSTQIRAASAPPDKRKATMATAQPEPKKSKAGGVYAAWRKQAMSPSAIITLAAEVQLLAAQLSEKSDIRLHVLRVARALIAAHDCLHVNDVSIAGDQTLSSPGTWAEPSDTSSSDSSEDTSSSSSTSICSSIADPERLAQEAMQNGDFSMQMAPDIIGNLLLTQRRIGIKCLAMGRQHFRGKPYAAANKKYPKVLEFLQALIALSLPQFDSSQVSINVVRGTTSEWHTDPRGQRSFVCTPVAQNPVLLQYKTLPPQSAVGQFVEVESFRQHRVFSDQQRVSLAIYWQVQTPKVSQQWIEIAVRYGDLHATQRHRLARHDDVHAMQQKVLAKLGIDLPEGWTIHTVAKLEKEVVMLAEEHQVQPQDNLAVTIVPGCTRRLPLPTFQGGGGGDEQVGKQLQKMKEADCRYTVAQRRAILAQSQHIKQLAPGNDLMRRKREMDKEAARLKSDPKGQVQSNQQQPAAQQGQDDKDGFQPVRNRKGKCP